MESHVPKFSGQLSFSFWFGNVILERRVHLYCQISLTRTWMVLAVSKQAAATGSRPATPEVSVTETWYKD